MTISAAQSFVSAIPYEKSSKQYAEIMEVITHYLAKDIVGKPQYMYLCLHCWMSILLSLLFLCFYETSYIYTHRNIMSYTEYDNTE